MSRRALLYAVRDTLHTRNAWDTKNCDIMFDGRPPPRAGQFFCSVHRGPRSNQSATYLDFIHTFYVTVTQRIKEPFDRLGTNLMELTAQGLDDIVDEKIVSIIHMDNTATIYGHFITYTGITQEPLAELPVYEGDDGGRIVGGDWFHAEPDAGLVGIAVQCRFRAVHTRKL